MVAVMKLKLLNMTLQNFYDGIRKNKFFYLGLLGMFIGEGIGNIGDHLYPPTKPPIIKREIKQKAREIGRIYEEKLALIAEYRTSSQLDSLKLVSLESLLKTLEADLESLNLSKIPTLRAYRQERKRLKKAKKPYDSWESWIYNPSFLVMFLSGARSGKKEEQVEEE